MGIYTLQNGYFPAILLQKAMVGDKPYHGFFHCLAKKSLLLECFAVLKIRFFLTGATGGCRNTLCISKTTGVSVGKKIPSKPCKSLCEAA